MQSNLEKYTYVSYVEKTNEKEKGFSSSLSKSKLKLAPGVFPICKKCGKECKTLSNDKYEMQVGTKATTDTPMLCPACKNVVCQQCASETDTNVNFELCPNCKSTAKLDWLLPFVYCENCGNQAVLLSNAIKGQVTYKILAKGAVPMYCTECHSINCADCISKSKNCKKCGSSKLGLFVPGHTGTEAIVAKVDSSGGNITLTMPDSDLAKSVKLNMEQNKIKQNEKVQKLIKSLDQPFYKFWISKQNVLNKLAKLGPLSKTALPEVEKFLSDANLRVEAINVYSAVGVGALDQIPSLLDNIKVIESKEKWKMVYYEGFAAATMAIVMLCAHINSETLKKNVIHEMNKLLNRKRVRNDTGLRSAAALVLFNLKEINSFKVTKYVVEHLEQNPSDFPTEAYLSTVLVVK